VPGFDVIIPARDEESTVGGVVRAAVAARGVSGVWVVDDGSRDATAAVARTAGARVIRARKRGRPGDKARALASGVAASGAEVVVFFDADIVGVHPRHFEALVAPVLAGEAALSCGMISYGALRNHLFLRLPPITGLRALRRDVFTAIPERRLHGYRIEILIDELVARRGLPTSIRVLHGLRHRTKLEKRGWRVGLPAHLAMSWQVATTLGSMQARSYVSYLRNLSVLPPVEVPGATAGELTGVADATNAAY
jgi:glycosyltransferase involved in cell wall biosynthesis